MDYKKFINECKTYLDKELGISFETIKDINEDTLLCDEINEFYGYYCSYKNYRISIMFYEEEKGYNYPVFLTIDENSENVIHFEYLAAINKISFDVSDLNKAYALIDKVINDL